jgi:hypothetical protein
MIVLVFDSVAEHLPYKLDIYYDAETTPLMRVDQIYVDND